MVHQVPLHTTTPEIRFTHYFRRDGCSRSRISRITRLAGFCSRPSADFYKVGTSHPLAKAYPSSVGICTKTFARHTSSVCTHNNSSHY